MNNTEEKTEKIRESARRHFSEALETYKAFASELHNFDRKFFDFRIALSGFLGIILTIVFTNKESFSFCFPIAITVVFILSFVFLLYEIWDEGRNKMKNMNSWERTVILHNILNSAVQRGEGDYAKEVVKIVTQENKIIKAMIEKQPVDKIIDTISQKRKWNWGFFIWGLLTLSVPFLFLLELL